MSTQSITSTSQQPSHEEVCKWFQQALNSRVLEGRNVQKAEAAYYFEDEENREKYVVEMLAGRGRATIHDVTLADDAQSGPVDEVHRDEKTSGEQLAPLPIAATPEDCWSQAYNSDIPTSDRVRALQECLLADNSRAVELIADELCRDNVPDEWRNAIVFAVENVHFKDSKQQARVRSRLRELALELRESPKVETEHVVWSAMRRFSSLLPAEKVTDLLEFLDRKGTVDTRMVALQCIARVFETSPPSDVATLEPLAQRVTEYADKFLDPDVFAGGENSSIARNAVLALAALGSHKLETCVGGVNALGRRWLSCQVRRQLQELLEGWKRHDQASEESSAYEVVERALKAVRPCNTG